MERIERIKKDISTYIIVAGASMLAVNAIEYDKYIHSPPSVAIYSPAGSIIFGSGKKEPKPYLSLAGLTTLAAGCIVAFRESRNRKKVLEGEVGN